MARIHNRPKFRTHDIVQYNGGHRMRIMIIAAAVMLTLAGSSTAQSQDPALEKALLAAPRQLKDAATVIKWKSDFTYDTLRKGTNRLVCYRTARPAWTAAILRRVHEHCESGTSRSKSEDRDYRRSEGTAGRLRSHGEGWKVDKARVRIGVLQPDRRQSGAGSFSRHHFRAGRNHTNIRLARRCQQGRRLDHECGLVCRSYHDARALTNRREVAHRLFGHCSIGARAGQAHIYRHHYR